MKSVSIRKIAIFLFLSFGLIFGVWGFLTFSGLLCRLVAETAKAECYDSIGGLRGGAAFITGFISLVVGVLLSRNLFLKKISVLLIFIIGSYFMFLGIRTGSFGPMIFATLFWGISSLAAFLFDKRIIVRLPFILGLIVLGIDVSLLGLTFGYALTFSSFGFFLLVPPVSFAISSLSYLFLGREKRINPS